MERRSIFERYLWKPVAMTVRGKLKLSVSGHMALRVLKGETNCCNKLDHAFKRYISNLSCFSSLLDLFKCNE